MVVFDDKKDVLCFEDTGRQLVLNVSNAETLIALFGDEPNNWAGRRVTLYLGSYGARQQALCPGESGHRYFGAGSDYGPSLTDSDWRKRRRKRADPGRGLATVWAARSLRRNPVLTMTRCDEGG